MEEPRNRYILLQDRVGEIVERSMLTLGLATKLIPTLLRKGELLEALPENEQPVDSTKIALGGIDRKIRVECRMEDVMKLTVEEADLLLAIFSVTLRYQICFDKKRLDFGKRLEYGSHVLVSIDGDSKILSGVVRFKGELLNSTGTMFGIELHKNPGFGTCDGRFQDKQYLTCALDKLAPLEDDNSELRTPSKSPKRDDHGQVNIKSKVDSVLPSFFKRKSDSKFPQPRNFDNLKIDQRVVTFCDEGPPLRGTVRYTGHIEDSSGRVLKILVGLELDERCGSGTGKWKGNQLFICERDHACFVDIESIMLEQDFDEHTENTKKKATSQKQDKQLRDLKMQGRRLDKEIPTRSLSYNVQHEASAIILAAGESSKTDTREFIKQQQQLLDDLKKNVVMDDDERTDSASSNLKFDYKHWEDTPPHNQSVTTQPLPGFSEAAYSDYVNVGKDGNEEALRDYNNRGEFDEQFKENVSSTPSSSLDSASIVATRESKTSSNPFISAASSDIHELKDENKRLKHEKTKLEKEISEKIQLEKERDDLLAQQKNHEKELRELQQEKDEIVKQKNNLQTDLRAKESQVYELETSLSTAQQALEDIQQLKDENNRLKLEKCRWEKEKNDVQEEKDELVVQNDSLQTDLRAKEAEVHELETTLATAQRALEECQQIKETCDWVVSRDEVEMTDTCLGVGGWGKVVLGTFRGCKVAVKEIHELILSPYSRRLFEREMNVASKCRHPCLLQFIGATNDDGIPLFITELLETSLRALLGQRQLADTEISTISLDISLALNYLHNMKPSPILHRDVSSANVLLWRQGDQWRGKVSDYGTANFVQQAMTKAPGAVIYSAPEAVSSNQTPKVDVYSFGVLLCEMCIREMPDPERRNQQVLLVKSRVLRNLVQKCLQANPVERPEMSQIIQEIQRF